MVTNTMKNTVIAIITLVLVMLCGCTKNSEIEFFEPTDESSSETQSTSSDVIEQNDAQISEKSINVTEFTGTNDEVTYEVQLNFDDGIYFEGNNIMQDREGVVPIEIYKPFPSSNPMHSLKIGGWYTFYPQISQTDDDTISIKFNQDDDSHEYHYSENSELTDGTYYYYNDFLVITYKGVAAGSNETYKCTAFFVPVNADFMLNIWFFHDVESSGAKQYFEKFFNNIKVEQI